MSDEIIAFVPHELELVICRNDSAPRILPWFLFRRAFPWSVLSATPKLGLESMVLCVCGYIHNSMASGQDYDYAWDGTDETKYTNVFNFATQLIVMRCCRWMRQYHDARSELSIVQDRAVWDLNVTGECSGHGTPARLLGSASWSCSSVCSTGSTRMLWLEWTVTSDISSRGIGQVSMAAVIRHCGGNHKRMIDMRIMQAEGILGLLFTPCSNKLLTCVCHKSVSVKLPRFSQRSTLNRQSLLWKWFWVEMVPIISRSSHVKPLLANTLLTWLQTLSPWALGVDRDYVMLIGWHDDHSATWRSCHEHRSNLLQNIILLRWCCNCPKKSILCRSKSMVWKLNAIRINGLRVWTVDQAAKAFIATHILLNATKINALFGLCMLNIRAQRLLKIFTPSVSCGVPPRILFGHDRYRCHRLSRNELPKTDSVDHVRNLFMLQFCESVMQGKQW